MFLRPSQWPARALAGICLVSVAALAFVLVSQHFFGVKPCPWCVLQRGIFLLIAAISGLGWLLRREKPLRNGALLLVIALVLAGIAAAVYQHDVAAQMATCSLTFADRVLSALQLETLLPSLFMVTANCSDAAQYQLLGQGYEVWAGLLFTLIGLCAAFAFSKRR